MKKITNLKDKLHSMAWLNMIPDAELGYVRADHDGCRWWNTWWPINDKVKTHELVDELNAVYDAFKRSFKDRETMATWCRRNLNWLGDDEFNAYYTGDHGFYWFRMIGRRGDYNLYLHCYSIDEIKKEAS